MLFSVPNRISLEWIYTYIEKHNHLKPSTFKFFKKEELGFVITESQCKSTDYEILQHSPLPIAKCQVTKIIVFKKWPLISKVPTAEQRQVGRDPQAL